MKQNRFKMPLIFLLLMNLLVACQMNTEQENHQDQENPGVETLASKEAKEAKEELIKEVTLQNTEGETIGEAILTQMVNGVLITLDASNLPPGVHGFHIHEKGICEPPTFESAGGHFNPTNSKHGFDHPEGPHAGDLPNIIVRDDGTVKAEVFADMVTLETGKENSLLQESGTSLMIHSGADDYHSQPSGDAGDRIACGVITNK